MSRATSKARPVLVFRHVPFEGAGLIEPALAGRGLWLQYIDLYRPGATPPDTSDAAGLIFLGGPMSVNDPLAYLAAESAILAEAVDRGQPVLGVCLGSQLIAKALGGRVYRNPRQEIGWFDIHLTEEGRGDAVLAPVDSPETVFHWHSETFDLPAGATHLAYSEACANQAFRVGSNVYGFQFHLEVTPQMIAEWCLADENCGDVGSLETPIDPACHAARLEQLSKQVFGRWCDLLG